MATTQTIDATIFASTHPDIAKRISVSGVLISSVRFIPYRNFPSFLEIKGGCLFTNKKCG